jgi:formylmethanofuran dehydrogenase subunit D
MSDLFILIAGRSSRQGTSLNEGKFTPGYVAETGTVLVNAADMARLGLADGDRIRLRSENGACEVRCQTAKGDEAPVGLLFLAYGDASSRLMSGETHGTGMPTSKGVDVTIEKLTP